MRLFNVFIVSVFLSVICLTACKRDLVAPVDNQTKLSQKEIEIKWAEARSGRWFNYSHYHALKQSEKETIDTLRYMDALYSYTKNAQLYYRKMLVSNYDNIVNVDSYLDSIYPLIYREMDGKMSNPRYMERLFSEYTNLELMPVPNKKLILKLSIDLDPITVSRCAIPQVARDFSYHLEQFDSGGFLGTGAGVCVFIAQQDLRNLKDAIYYKTANCDFIERELRYSFERFKTCIERELSYMNIGDDYWDPFPPRGIPSEGDEGDDEGDDPCVVKQKLNKKFNLQDLKDKINYLVNVPSMNTGAGNEHGFTTELSGIDKKTITNTNPFDGGNESLITFTIKTGEPLTVGFYHNHPSGTAHSVRDLFFGADLYMGMSAENKELFAKNFTSSVIADDRIFVVTIKDIDAWLAYANHGYTNGFDDYISTMKNLDVEYMKLQIFHPNYRVASLLEMFGDAVNIFVSDVNDINFEPLVFDKTENDWETPCD